VKKAIWGVAILSLMILGCGKRTKKVYVYQRDTIAPIVQITYPSDGQKFYINQQTQKASVDILYLVTDMETGIRKITIYHGSAGEEREWPNNEEVPQKYEGVSSAYFRSTGVKTIVVRAYDFAGNVGLDSLHVIIEERQ